MQKKIILTGGGTAGHVMPNLALLPALAQKNFVTHYIGSHTGIEKELAAAAGLEYHTIASGKLRRYFDLKNISDMLRVVKGLGDALKIIGKIKPDIVFSKGGFVTVPVAVAARLKGVPLIIHESDYSPGLANRLALPFSKAVCCNFPETQKKLPRAHLTGTPIRAELLNGDREKGLKLCGFAPDKPVVMFMGGSQGARAINTAVAEILPRLLEKFQVIHLTGRGNLSECSDALRAPAGEHSSPLRQRQDAGVGGGRLRVPQGYAPFEYAADELPHFFAAADIVVSRAGAGSIFELLALAKPNLLIPLSRAASRGDQILNARSFAAQGFSAVLQEEELTAGALYDAIQDLFANRGKYVEKMRGFDAVDSTAKILEVIEKHMGATSENF